MLEEPLTGNNTPQIHESFMRGSIQGTAIHSTRTY
jgi:hypothetical protein